MIMHFIMHFMIVGMLRQSQVVACPHVTFYGAFNWTKWRALMCLNYCPLLMLTLQYVFPYKSSLDFYFPSFTLRQNFRLAFYIYGQMCPSLSGSLHNVPGIKTYWKVNPYLQRELMHISPYIKIYSSFLAEERVWLDRWQTHTGKILCRWISGLGAWNRVF